ncbi:hypothetical protein PFISCL1PPCAC_17490, partial [Pristionchus fissidentatus]
RKPTAEGNVLEMFKWPSNDEFFTIQYSDGNSPIKVTYGPDCGKCDQSEPCLRNCKEKMKEALDVLWLGAAGTMSCDDGMWTPVEEEDPEGRSYYVGMENNKFVYDNADGAQLNIRLPDKEWIEVDSVFCPDTVWAYREFNNKTQIKRIPKDEKFDIKCMRKYCTFCGEIDYLPCPKCTRPQVEHCVPSCPNDLWWYSDSVLKSNLTCEGNINSV